MHYRQIQVFTILSNQCLQTYIFPAVQFLGGMLIILMLSGLLLFQTRIPTFGIVSICFLIVAMLLINCVMMDLGSRSILISKKVLQETKKMKGCKWSQRFFKSCPFIALRIGEFHKMDRERVASFIRFILQRTFLIVLRTKLSKGFGKNTIILLPI